MRPDVPRASVGWRWRPGRRALLANPLVRHRRPLLLLFAATLGWTALSFFRPMLHAGDGLAAEYFSNAEWSEPPAFSTIDAQPSTAIMMRRWEGAPPDRFSVRWFGYLTVGRPGTYHFATESDDGSELAIDNVVVVENHGAHALVRRTGSVRLDRGPHLVVLRYAQYGAEAALSWTWSRDGADYTSVPAWALSWRRTGYGTVAAARILDWVLRLLSVLAIVAAVWYLQARLGAWQALSRWAGTRRLAFAKISMFILILWLPWPDGGEQSLFEAVAGTTRDLNTTALRTLARFKAFQADINRPHTGEYVLPSVVQEALTMLRRHGVDRYQISDAIAANEWVFQQMVASAWPRKMDKYAQVRLVLNSEPLAGDCRVIERQREVAVARCP